MSLALTICDACILVPWLEILYWSFHLYPTLLCAGRVTYLDPLPFGFRLGLANGMNQQKMQEWGESELGVYILCEVASSCCRFYQEDLLTQWSSLLSQCLLPQPLQV